MKKIITALLNKTVNDKLRTYEEIQVVMNDIQYQEGIIEALEINPEIEVIILSELLPGELNIKELIEKIKQTKNEIKIIIILEKENKELENYLLAKGNINIFYNNEIKIKEIAELIISKNKSEELEIEIKKLKEIIMNNNEGKKYNTNNYIEENNIKNNLNSNLDNEASKNINYEEIQGTKNNLKCDLLNDKVINDKIINSKVINDKVINNKAISNEAINNKVLNNKAINNNAINDKIINDEIINNNAINNSRINSKVMTDTIINENKLIKKQENKNEIITKNEKREIEEEIEKEYNKNLMQNKILNKKIINLFRKEKTNNNCKIIIVSGIAGVGKSILTVNIAKALEKQKRKVLIIDFDFLNNSIQTLFGIKIKNKREINNINSFEYINDFNNIFNNINNIENLNKIKNIDNNKNINNIEQYNTQPKINWEKLIIKINSKIKLISNINSLFTENQIDDLQLLKIINEIKTKYDFIILDIENNNCLKSLAEECDKIIFITEPNILQIKKSKKLLEKYINEFKIEKEKLYILFNKVKNDSLSFNILKDIFKNYNIIGKINFIKNYNVLINQNMNSIFLENKIKKQYKKISKKLSQNNKIKKYYIDKIENL